MTTPARAANVFQGAIDPGWFDEGLRGTSATWRLMFAEEAVASHDLAGDGLDVDELDDMLAAGWPRQANALLLAAWWVAEALWRNGVAASTLSVHHLRRARQIGLALLATTPASAPSEPAAAAWLAADLFDESSCTTIRLQLPRTAAFDADAGVDLMRQFAPAQAAKLVGYARSAVGLP